MYIYTYTVLAFTGAADERDEKKNKAGDVPGRA